MFSKHPFASYLEMANFRNASFKQGSGDIEAGNSDTVPFTIVSLQ